MKGPYADHLLDAKDVCSNCFRRIKTDRVSAYLNDDGGGTSLGSHYSRRQRSTTKEHVDSIEEPAHSEMTFCDCGVADAYHREWDPTDINRPAFKELVKQAITTLEAKGVTLRSKETARYAASHWADHGDVDRALATALESGIVAAAVGGSGGD